MQRLTFSLLVLLLLFREGVHAQDSISISYAKRISPEALQPFLEVLASDSLEGRETGRPGQKKAAAFIENHFRSLSLKAVSHGGYIQHTPLSARANGSRNIKVNDKSFVFMRDYFYPEGFKDTTYLFHKILFAGYGISSENYDDYKKIKMDSGAVMFFDGMPVKKNNQPSILTSVDLQQKAKTAAAKGATMFFLITDSLENIIERSLYDKSEEIPAAIPCVYITPELAMEMFSGDDKQHLEKAMRKVKRDGKPSSIAASTPGKFCN